MKEYLAVFVNNGKTHHIIIENHLLVDDDLFIIFKFEGIEVGVELDGNLFIEKPSTYSSEQLGQFSFSEVHEEFALLTDYQLNYDVPVIVTELATGEHIETTMYGQINHTRNQKLNRLELLEAEIVVEESYQLFERLNDLQPQLAEYNIHLCAFCKFGQENPYGGDLFMNYLCFKKNKTDFIKRFPKGVGKTDWAFFRNPDNCSNCYIFNSCEEFE